jgi:hypothetical protein
MDFFAHLAARSVPAFIALLFIALFVAREIGLWLGRRHAAVDGAAEPEGVGLVVGSMLGLLAFVLALTLSSSNSRFQERRQNTLTEASAISSAVSRAQAVTDPRGQEIVRKLADYTRVRMAFVEAPPDPVQLAEIERRSATLQGEMQRIAVAIVQAQPNSFTTSLLNYLDTAFGAATSIRFAFSTRMMPQLFWLLLGMALVSVGGMGYQTGLRKQTLRKFSLLIIVMWTAVITEILDLGTPRIGTISNSTAVYQWVLDEIAAAAPPGTPR